MAVLFRDNPDAHGNSLWLADTERKTITRLTPDAPMDQRGVVSVDGKTVLTTATTGYQSLLMLRPLVSSGKEEKLADAVENYGYVQSQSKDGKYVIFSIQDPKTGFDVYFMDVTGNRKLTPMLTSPYAEVNAKLSPDDKWLVYGSDENGQMELYVTPFPGGGFKWQVSSGGVASNDNNTSVVDWSPDGKSLYYRQGDKIYTVDVRVDGNKPEFSAPKVLMSLPKGIELLSILTDGKRILATRPVGQLAASPQSLVLNWQRLVQ
jgi:Tol biopolymer transport system component